MEKYRITIVGMGYVGMSLAVLLAGKHLVYAVDNNQEIVDSINAGKSSIKGEDIREYLQDRNISFYASTNPKEFYSNSDFVIVCAPTDYDSARNCFDTSAVEEILGDITRINDEVKIVIKSTVPVGFTERMRRELNNKRIFYSPEFLRESKALYDNLHPSRIVVGTDVCDNEQRHIAELFADLLEDASQEDEIEKKITGISEAEAIKLFSNTFLAMRVAFFNELDTYAEANKLNAAHIIDGVCLDPRIGDYYNNPSFGYGGYCLPKDTKQLLANYESVPEKLIDAIIEANRVRKDYITNRILNTIGYDENDSVTKCLSSGERDIIVGIFRLAMKNKSDNFRNSSVQGIIRRIKNKGVKVMIYEPSLANASSFLESPVTKDLETFKKKCSLIIANRYDSCLDDVHEKVYTRDIFGRD